MMLGGGFGAAGAEVVIEEFLEGEEASFFALCDGETAIPFGTAQDHKRVGDGDEGPNTGGMGAYSPAAVLTPELQARVMREIIEPTLAGMRARGTPYPGVLYAGLMLTDKGPKLIEYNARFGDPETQVLMPRLKTDLSTALLAACDGVLSAMSLLDGRGGADSGDGGQWISGRGQTGSRSGARAGRSTRRRASSSTPARSRMATGSRQRRPRAQRHGHRRAPSPRRRRRAYEAVDADRLARAVSAAAISVGERSSGSRTEPRAR